MFIVWVNISAWLGGCQLRNYVLQLFNSRTRTAICHYYSVRAFRVGDETRVDRFECQGVAGPSESSPAASGQPESHHTHSLTGVLSHVGSQRPHPDTSAGRPPGPTIAPGTRVHHHRSIKVTHRNLNFWAGFTFERLPDIHYIINSMRIAIRFILIFFSFIFRTV